MAASRSQIMLQPTDVNRTGRLLSGAACCALVCAGLFVGCDQAGDASRKRPPAKRKPVSPRVATATTEAPGKQRAATRRKRSRPRRWTRAAEPQSLGLNSTDAVAQVARAVDASLDLGPVLVVWIIDRSQSAATLRRQVLPRVQEWYLGQPSVRGNAENQASLATAIVTFGSEIEMALDPPTDQAAEINRILGNIQVDASGREVTFAAIRSTLDKYLPFRTRQAHELVLVVISDEAGDDADQVDHLLETPRKYSIPIYAIGVPAPFGRESAVVTTVEATDGAADSNPPTIQQGPESRKAERIDLEFPANLPLQLLDSGFGPFALERLCRATGGRFLTLRTPPSGGLAFGTPTTVWPRGDIPQFDAEVMRRYAPDDLATAEYDSLVAGNQAMSALRQAADLGHVECLKQPPLEFVKPNDAALTRSLEAAQKLAAKQLPRINQLYEFLQQGVGGRATLERPRWQAAFDLAMGRAAAAKARADGYNQMLAALKRGRLFLDAGSTIWVLEPNASIESSSALRNLIKKAKQALTRVVEQHPQTPWAHIAQQELQIPMGWRWSER